MTPLDFPRIAKWRSVRPSKDDMARISRMANERGDSILTKINQIDQGVEDYTHRMAAYKAQGMDIPADLSNLGEVLDIEIKQIQERLGMDTNLP